MRLFRFESRLWLPRPKQEIFEFFSNASNLERITPPWLRFRIITPMPIEMREGTLIDYRLKIRGFPARWQSRISVWNPPSHFVDEQVHGPYRIWIHEHRFLEESGGASCEDNVQYAPLGGALINRLFVERDIHNIFAYRSDCLREIYGEGQPRAAPGWRRRTVT